MLEPIHSSAATGKTISRIVADGECLCVVFTDGTFCSWMSDNTRDGLAWLYEIGVGFRAIDALAGFPAVEAGVMSREEFGAIRRDWWGRD